MRADCNGDRRRTYADSVRRDPDRNNGNMQEIETSEVQDDQPVGVVTTTEVLGETSVRQGAVATQPPIIEATRGTVATQPPDIETALGAVATQPPITLAVQGDVATQPPVIGTLQGAVATQPPDTAAQPTNTQADLFETSANGANVAANTKNRDTETDEHIDVVTIENEYTDASEASTPSVVPHGSENMETDEDNKKKLKRKREKEKAKPPKLQRLYRKN